MGVERISRTAKLDPETDLWIEGIRLNVFPWVTRSAAINLVLTVMRDAFAAKDLHATREFWQEMHRKLCVQGVPEMQGIPGRCSVRSDDETAKILAWMIQIGLDQLSGVKCLPGPRKAVETQKKRKSA